MACKYCGETDPFLLTMSTRMINGMALSFDVCFRCYWRDKFEAGVKEKIEVIGMQNRKALRSPDWKGIYKDRGFLELLEVFYKQGKGYPQSPEMG